MCLSKKLIWVNEKIMKSWKYTENKNIRFIVY